MTKMQGDLQDDPGKEVNSLATKNSGSLDKDSLAGDDATSGYDYEPSAGSDYASGYDSDSSEGYDGGGSGGYGGGSSTSDDTTDSESTGSDPTSETGGDENPEASPPDDDTSGSDDDQALYAEGTGDEPEDTGEEPAPIEIGEPPDDTKPGEPVIPPENKVSIDIEAMTRLVAAMERAGDQVVELQGELRSILSGVQLDTSETNGFDQVTAWIEEVLPDLRRRLALAQDLEGDSPRRVDPHLPVTRQPIITDETQIPTLPPHKSFQNGNETAQRFSVPAEQKPAVRDLVTDLRSGQHDPYYAKEFVHNADPKTLVETVRRATSDGTADTDELVQLTASTVATGSRGTGDLAPPEGHEEQWAALRNSDDPETAAVARQLRPAPADESAAPTA
ncbi:hypothetical protein CLV30_102176 [Haloactinopolyspora alba]|uniref:Uncharacterized protein n=1 Tax=Haloactinopolyspora alba TaxID=648780 RepID=A0A2P8EBF0_9ACTN|nr:hypothetical protein [Haloactinopolyspora alba]PSL06788.1 hypothetical protein CLV30_102176 [Haloactinopolyspora alba]